MKRRDLLRRFLGVVVAPTLVKSEQQRLLREVEAMRLRHAAFLDFIAKSGWLDTDFLRNRPHVTITAADLAIPEVRAVLKSWLP